MTTVSVVLLVYLAIFLHELGHFAEAQRLNLPVERFSVGLSPFGLGLDFHLKRFPGTTFCLGFLPIGGFVEIQGEKEKDQNDPDQLDTLSYQDLALFSGAGIWMNLLSIIGAALLLRRLISPLSWDWMDMALIGIGLALYFAKSILCRFLILPMGLLVVGSLIYGFMTYGVQESVGGPITFMHDVKPQNLELREVFGKFMMASALLALMNTMPIAPLDGAIIMDRLLQRWKGIRLWYDRVCMVLALGLVSCALFKDAKLVLLSLFR